MIPFHQRSIATQVRWALGLLTLVGAAGVISMLVLARSASERAVKVYRDRLQPIQQLMEVTQCYTMNITFVLREVRAGVMGREQGFRTIRDNQVRARVAWERYRWSRGATPGVQEVEASLQRLHGLNREMEGLVPLGAGKDLGVFADNTWIPEVHVLSGLLDKLREDEDRQARSMIRALERQSARTLRLGAGLLALMLASAAAFGLAFSRHLKTSLDTLVAHLRHVADGNLAPIPVQPGRSELMVAGRELNRTSRRLRQMVNDLREQRAREHELVGELRASETRYRQLAERLPDVVYQTQAWPDGRRTWPFVSPQFEAFYGTGPEALEEDPLYSFRKLHPDDQQGFLEALEASAKALKPLAWEGRTFTERPGEMRWIRVRRSPTPQPDGSTLWDGVLEDITQLKQSEEALRLSEARAQEASRAKSAFLASMSHELRTPLSAILGYTRLMCRDEGRAESDRVQLQHVLRAGEHLLALINDVLSLSKIEAGRMELRAASFSPTEMVREMEALFRLGAEGKGLAFLVETGALPDRVLGDLPKIRQVLVNLLGNAVKFTERGAVTLALGWHGDRGFFRVEDTGPGIAREEQGELFSPFKQTSRGQDLGGTGLGLFISRSLVELMGGSLDLRSEPGWGTAFLFDLPLPPAEPEALEAGRGQVTGLAPDQAPPTLLVVDDREINRDHLGRLLTLVGLRCTQAATGEEGLRAWRELRPDAILMDLRMPGVDGFEAIARLRREESEAGMKPTPVVAVSASVYDVSVESLRQQGFDAFLTKPVDEEQLFGCLEDLLGLRFERREPAWAEAPAGPGLDGLSLQDGDWRRRMLDKVAEGDLEEAEALLPDLPDAALAGAVRDALRAYRLEEILQFLR